MFSREDIMSRLAAGETIEDIANDAANALNEANAAYQKQKAEKEEAEKLALQKQEAKKQSVSKIGNAILDYMESFYPDFFDDDMRNVFSSNEFGDSIVQSIDNAFQEFGVNWNNLQKTNENISKAFKFKDGGKAEVNIGPNSLKIRMENVSEEDKDPIKDFLKKNGL